MRHLFPAAVLLITAANASAATLAVQGRANATPSVAAANEVVAVAWGATNAAGLTDVFAAVSRNGGRTFSEGVRVSDERHASLGAEQPPRVSLVPRAGHDPEVVVVWTAKSNDGSRLLVARSWDGGTSFARATPLPGSEAGGNRGWESTAVDRDGHVVAVWLDHREMSSSGGASMHHEGHDHTAAGTAKSDGAARAQASKLYFTTLDSASGSHAITGGVCYCCKTAVATGPDGAIYAAWRHVYAGNLRDIAFTMSRDGGRTFTTPTRVSNDGWILDGCPENGPALAAGADGAVHAVWPTLIGSGRQTVNRCSRCFMRRAGTADRSLPASASRRKERLAIRSWQQHPPASSPHGTSRQPTAHDAWSWPGSPGAQPARASHARL